MISEGCCIGKSKLSLIATSMMILGLMVVPLIDVHWPLGSAHDFTFMSFIFVKI